MLSEFLYEKYKENLQKGFKGLGLVYSGLWSLCKKYSGISDGKLLVEELNKELGNYGLVIVPDKRAKLKLVKRSREETISRELEAEFEEFMKKYK